MPKYGADEVLNTIVSAIAMLRERQLSTKPGQCILVGHDWGAVISSRIAMETQGLIDRVVVINGPVPKIFFQNLHAGFKSCCDHLRTWWRKKTNLQELHDAKEAMRPVLAQLLKSNYVFMFNLPFFSTTRFGFVTEHLISYCHRAAAKTQAALWENWSWASSIGPGAPQCAANGKRLFYGNSVQARAMKHPRGDWDTRIRLYREGLLSGDWTLRNAGDVKQMDTRDKTRFHCPASFVFGLEDPALDYRICVKGVERFFQFGRGKQVAASHIILLEECGHWSPLEETGTNALRALLLEIMGVINPGSSTSTRPRIQRSDFR